MHAPPGSKCRKGCYGEAGPKPLNPTSQSLFLQCTNPATQDREPQIARPVEVMPEHTAPPHGDLKPVVVSGSQLNMSQASRIARPGFHGVGIQSSDRQAVGSQSGFMLTITTGQAFTCLTHTPMHSGLLNQAILHSTTVSTCTHSQLILQGTSVATTPEPRPQQPPSLHRQPRRRPEARDKARGTRE